MHHLRSIVDYLDDASLTQITQTAIGLSTPQEVVSHFSSLLGDDSRIYSFISEFNSRRFPPSVRAPVPSRRAEQKSDRRAETGNRKPVGNTMLSSDLGKKTQARPKVKKVDAISEIDAALRDLEMSEEKKKATCDCAARRHGLNPIAPNCLSCGKIICAIESYARCSFCHAQLLNRDQKDEIVAELKRERGMESAAAKNQSKKASAGSGVRVAYSGKLGANYGSALNEDELRKKTEAAETRKNELLDHVRSGYRRTVIDQASDFTSQAADKWSSPQERALALRKAQAAMHADEDRGRVISLSIGKGKVSVKNERRQRPTEEELDGEIVMEQRRIDEEKKREEDEQERINQSYTRNKLIGHLGTITFSGKDDPEVGKVNWWSKGQKGWRRVQDEDGLDESLLLESLAVDGQPGREEEVGTSKRF